jgi:hypothetical protein
MTLRVTVGPWNLSEVIDCTEFELCIGQAERLPEFTSGRTTPDSDSEPRIRTTPSEPDGPLADKLEC